jgi:hypothetical protein
MQAKNYHNAICLGLDIKEPVINLVVEIQLGGLEAELTYLNNKQNIANSKRKRL